MSVLGRNVSANLLSNLWSVLLALILTPLYVLLLGVESYGLIGFHLSLVAVLGILDTGISATAVREIAWLVVRPEGRRTIPDLVFSLEVVYWGIVLMLGVCGLAAVWFFGAGWFQTKSLAPEVVREALLLMVVSLAIQIPSGLYLGGMVGLQRQVESSGLAAVFGTVRGAGAIALLWMVSADIRMFFLWQVVFCIVQTLVLRNRLWRRIPMEPGAPRLSIKILSSVKGYAGGMMLIAVSGIAMTQVDKFVLSKMVTLEALGYYMLAWAAASGLTRVASPLIQAFSPRFTELVSEGDETQLERQLHLASQLMSVFILPAAAFIAFLAEPIVFAWIGNRSVAVAVAPILSVMAAGTALSAISYPALSVLYSKKELRPVIRLSLGSLIVCVPVLIAVVAYFGTMGAAMFWCGYGIVLYVSCEILVLRRLASANIPLSVLKDFLAPLAVSATVAAVAGVLLSHIEGRVTFIAALAASLMVAWFLALLACTELRNTVKRSFT